VSGRQKILSRKFISCLLIALLSVSSAGYGALTLSLITSPGFGLFFSGASGRQFILNTSSTISGTHASDYISGAAAGQFTLADDSSPNTVTILVNNISTLGGLTVNEALCSYNGGAQGRCDAAGMNVTSVGSATLKLGLDISTSTAHSGGDTSSITMDLSVSYL
jgi:hypothetical protein